MNSKVKAHPSQHTLLHGFQTLHFICNRFGCKLWLISIQIHTRNHFQVFAHHHLKLLRCLIGIWSSFGCYWFIDSWIDRNQSLQLKHSKWKGMCESNVEICIDWIRIKFWFKDFFSNLPLKIIIHCVIDPQSIIQSWRSVLHHKSSLLIFLRCMTCSIRWSEFRSLWTKTVRKKRK